MHRQIFNLISSLSLTLSALTTLYAQPELDISFNGNGRAVIDMNAAGRDEAHTVVVQPDRKIIVAGGNPYSAPIRGVRVGLTNAAGETRWAITSTFGFFVFDNIPTGQTYTLFVRGSKHHTFDTRTFGLNEAVTGMDLTGTPSGNKPGGAKDGIEARGEKYE